MIGIIFSILLTVLGLIEFAHGEIFNSFLLFMSGAAFYFALGYHGRTYILWGITKFAFKDRGSKKKEPEEPTDDEPVEDFLK